MVNPRWRPEIANSRETVKGHEKIFKKVKEKKERRKIWQVNY
jgi:hypothetical protein